MWASHSCARSLRVATRTSKLVFFELAFASDGARVVVGSDSNLAGALTVADASSGEVVWQREMGGEFINVGRCSGSELSAEQQAESSRSPPHLGPLLFAGVHPFFIGCS